MGERARENVPGPNRLMSPAFHSSCRAASRALIVSSALALSAAASRAQQAGADGPSKALEGKWSIELYLGTPSARTEPLAGQINGEIAFSNTAWWNPSDRFGRHSLNLQSFFGRSFLRPPNVTPFGPGDTSMVTEVSGSVRGDSVGIDFIPRIDHGGVSMWGRFWGDSAKGTWHRRGTDGDGRFVLRRLSKEAVAVAAIPDGRPVAVAVAPAKPLTKAELRAKTRADAAAKLKADADARTLARAQAQEKAKADAVAKAQARDSANARAVALAQARKDSVAQARVALAARRDSAAQAKIALVQAKKDSVAQAKLAVAQAKKDSIAQARAAVARAKQDSIARTPAAVAARRDSAEKARLALVAALKDSIAQVRAALAARTGGTRSAAQPAATTPATVAANNATRPAAPVATPASTPASTPAVATNIAANGAAATGTRPSASPGGGLPNATVAAPPAAAARTPVPAATPPAGTPAAAPAAAAPANALRVRTYDVASNTYFVTKYSLHLPDGHWLYGRLRTGSGADGWGPAVVRPPGKYEIEVTDFMCGDKVWFLKNKILKPVVIEPGSPTDVTIDINVKTEPARPSLENKEGATCSVLPGTPR